MKKTFNRILEWLRDAPEPKCPEVFEYHPVSDIVYDEVANRSLHKFLLKESNWDRKTTVSAHGVEYEVGVISIDTAPRIPHASS